MAGLDKENDRMVGGGHDAGKSVSGISPVSHQAIGLFYNHTCSGFLIVPLSYCVRWKRSLGHVTVAGVVHQRGGPVDEMTLIFVSHTLWTNFRDFKGVCSVA